MAIGSTKSRSRIEEQSQNYNIEQLLVLSIFGSSGK